MNNRFMLSPPLTRDDETILQPATRGSERAKVCCPKRAVVAGSGPHLTKETQDLLRLRLRAAALILLVGFGVFLVRHVVGVLAGEPLSPVLLGFHVLVVLVLGFSAAPLCRTVTLSADAHFSGPAWSLGRAPTRRPRASRIPATVGP